MAVNNKQPVGPSRGRLCIGVKVLQLRQRKLVVNLASSRNSYYLVARQISVLGRDKDLACKDKKQ
jgi:hypothetical protein